MDFSYLHTGPLAMASAVEWLPITDRKIVQSGNSDSYYLRLIELDLPVPRYR
jgi:hypothetical protein